MKLRLRTLFLLASFATSTACTGIGAAILITEGGISGTGISYGTILAFSSVVINGTKLDLDSETEVFVDGQVATENDLKIGYVIRVETDFDEGIAKRIDYVETVRGPLTTAPSINPDTLDGTLNVLGQIVTTNSTTVFDGITDLTTLSVGDVLDISGVRDSNRAIVAHYLVIKPPPVAEYRLVGKIESLSPTTFAIGNLTINYASADTGGLSGGIPVAGAEVRVVGSAGNFDSGSSAIVADQIGDSLLSFNFEVDDAIEIEGVVTQFTSISDFEVNGLRVDGENAEIEDGEASDIALNSLIEVEGVIDEAGVLVANKLEIEQINVTHSFRIEAPVDSVDATSKTLVVLGITIQVDGKTQLEDESDIEIDEFSLQDLSSGDWVEVRGFVDDSDIFASRVERDDPEDEVRLQAPVDTGGVDALNKTVTILGVSVATDASTEYEDTDENSLTESQFFTTINEGDLVKAKWEDFTSTTSPVGELSLE